MVMLPGYRITNKIYDGFRTLVYRGQRESDQKAVVIKLLKSEYPTFKELVEFRNQYTITKNLDLPGIVQPMTLENYRNGFALVMEDFGGVALTDYTTQKQLSIVEFLNIAIQIAQTLEGLHHNRIIHKDIKPQNILINPETKQVKLIDFSISSLLPRENQESINPNVLEGTLAYMSPEQTGRMNRGIDYRTDFYSLGVTFYELLTGQLPFVSQDPMELVHCHIARIPTPPTELNPAIPVMVNDIIMKLMAKTAEERYQSAFGLRIDLETFLQQYSEKGSITQFPLGRRDISERFVIPEKLYGREAEVATLLAAFDRVSNPPSPLGQGELGGSEMMLVAGFSGIGKTAVVSEVHKPIVRQRGYFIKGKFDQFKRDIPFRAWVQAFQNLMRQLLTESAAEVQKWKTGILEALGQQGRVMIDVIPELELLIDKQPEVPELEGSTAQNRFNLLFQKFIRVFATSEHPLVIFLDDLQWADSASLKLMQLLMNETDTRYLLLIGAYRDNEVSPAHPLMLTLNEIRKTSATVNQITLAPLNEPSLNRLIADTLSCPPQRAVPLTELVKKKTKGNPFFTNQFLKALYEDGLISFDFSCGYWQCDIAQVRALSVSDDVVEFMATQLQKLPENTQNVLSIAACIGNSFDLATLAVVCEKSQAVTAAELWRALQEGVVIPTSEVYKFFQDEGGTTQYGRDANTDGWIGSDSSIGTFVNSVSCAYQFLHDRIQQAAYFLIPENQKKSTHLKIGRLLLSNTTETEREEKIFDIVNQLNYGVELISQQAERQELAQLNLIAGRKAMASTAYAAAIAYFTLGIELLAAQAWLQSYDLSLALHESAAEAAYLNGEFEQMEHFADIVLQQAKTLLDKVKVYEVKIQSCQACNKLKEAVQTGIQVLSHLGVDFPTTPSQLDIQQGLEEIQANLQGKNLQDLLNLPEMTEPYKKAAMRIITNITAATYNAAPDLYPLTVFKHVNLSLKYGNDRESPLAYGTYGLILCGVVGDIEAGFQFGQLSTALLSRFNPKASQARPLYVFNHFIRPWKEHIREIVQPLQNCYCLALDSGDLEQAGWCLTMQSLSSYFMGQDLLEIEEQLTRNINRMRKLKQERVIPINEIFRQTALNLMGYSVNPCRLIGEFYNEEEMLPQHQEANDLMALCYLYINRIFLCYLFGETTQALEMMVIAETYLDGVKATIAIPIFYLYKSLILLNVYFQFPNNQQESIFAQVQSNQEKMKKWADYAPSNYLHKFYLVEAERHRVMGQNLEAMEMYDRAIAGAKENEYIQEEALANELAAKFYLAWGKEKIAQTYLTDAYYCYVRWGAQAKVEDLEKRYPQLLAPILNQEKSLNRGETIAQMISGTVSSNSSGSSDVLDLATVIKASQAISGEIQLEKLLSILMQVVIENAGASFGALILPQAGKWVIEATKVSGNTPATVLQSIPVSSSQEIPVTPINYVSRTSQTLVINNVTSEATFAADPYIIKHQPKSLLCLPIINQGKLIGILYLENNLTTDAFTPDRLEVLKLLSSQAAISIENALLYSQVKDSESRLAQFLEAMPVGVFVADANGIPYYANQTAQQILGKGIVANAANEQLAEVYQVYLAGGKQLYPSDRDALLRALKGESATIDDMEIRQPNKIVPIEVWGTPIFDEKGKVAYAMVAFQDIRERKKAEAERLKFTQELFQLNHAFSRFVPRQFLQFLEKESIVDVQLGDAVQQEMSVLFSDIRDFTTFSESMTPQENFKFINAYLRRMEPAIIKNQGFIDKYIGDAIMALFSGSADDAVKAGIAMLQQLAEYNQHRLLDGYTPIQIGIGINTGSLMLGTVGGHSRMDGTVISDAVNLASRFEGLTKNYGVSMLISHHTFLRLPNPTQYAIRLIDQVQIKGKSELVTVYEVFDADAAEIKEKKLATLPAFTEALSLYKMNALSEAAQLFQDILSINPEDKVAQIYLERCLEH
jgi:PAS domain S-box-containing protein